MCFNNRHIIYLMYSYIAITIGARTFSLRVQFTFRAALPVHRFRPMHLVFQAHVTAQIGSTTESGVAEDAGRLVAMHFEVLGQRGEVPVNVSADSARKTPRALHQHLTGCIANVLPIASHPPCNTLTQPRDPPVPHNYQRFTKVTREEGEKRGGVDKTRLDKKGTGGLQE